MNFELEQARLDNDRLQLHCQKLEVAVGLKDDLIKCLVSMVESLENTKFDKMVDVMWTEVKQYESRLDRLNNGPK